MCKRVYYFCTCKIWVCCVVKSGENGKPRWKMLKGKWNVECWGPHCSSGTLEDSFHSDNILCTWTGCASFDYLPCGGGNIGLPPPPFFFLSFFTLPPLNFNPGIESNKLRYTTQVCFFLAESTFKSLNVRHHANWSGKLFNLVHDCAYNAWIDFHPLHVAGIAFNPTLPVSKK